MTAIFIEKRLPTDISYGSVGGPEFMTQIVTTQNGYEYRNIRWELPRSKFNIAYGVKTQDQLEKLRDFYYVVQGKAFGFRFQDPFDYSAKNQEIGKGDAETQKFQLIKHYAIDDQYAYKRVIYKPVASTVTLYIKQQEKTVPCNDYQLNETKGEIILKSPLKKGEILYANFHFDIPVRFDTDYLPARLNSHNAVQYMDIPIIEIRL